MQKDLEDEELSAIQRFSRQYLLIISFTLLTAGAAFTVLLIAEGAIRFATFIILGIAFLLAFFYGVPPLRLAYNGYGELSEGIIYAGLIPAFAYLLQTGDLHRLLPMLSFPLLAFYLAMRLAHSLEHYARDQKLGRRPLILQIGWKPGMALHNVLILVGYLLLVASATFGMPWSLTWPGLLTLPLGLFQIFQMNQIAAGAKPGWRVLKLTAAATFALTAYLLALAIWTG
jgi:1,4-dihydroxy-2-naphthoate octaprenyltransferase